MSKQLGGNGAAALGCVCGNFLVRHNDTLIQCTRCNNWFHPECVELDSQPSLLAKVQPTFVCPVCSGSYRKRTRDGSGPPRQQRATPVREVVDTRPKDAAFYETLIIALRDSLAKDGFVEVAFPAEPLTDAVVSDCMAACATSIADHTFSESYPRYCLREQQLAHHKYLQGCAARDVKTKQVVACVLSNGMDPYANLRNALTHMKTTISRGNGKPSRVTDGAASLVSIDDFVHYTLLVTHDKYRGRGLAKRLLLIDMARWAIRGRTRGFLNMALQKTVTGGHVKCSLSEASMGLYQSCGFCELCHRIGDNGELLWTKTEEDLGRVMINLDALATLNAAAGQYRLARRTVRLRSGS